jgi:predicted nucleotidyltransferase
VGEELELVLDMIGSFATGLWTYHSDIDLVFINEKTGFVNIGYLL